MDSHAPLNAISCSALVRTQGAFTLGPSTSPFPRDTSPVSSVPTERARPPPSKRFSV